MRHSRFLVFLGSFGALVLMTVMSTALGWVIPNLISSNTVKSAACLLYTIFGFRLLYIGYKAPSPNSSERSATMAGEIDEVQTKIDDLENQNAKFHVPKEDSILLKKIFNAIFSPVFIESFVLTFLAEWGDRSQIATITVRQRIPLLFLDVNLHQFYLSRSIVIAYNRASARIL